MKQLDTTFTEEDFTDRKRPVKGLFPGHVVGFLKGKPVKDKKTGTESYPFNLVVKIAPEAADYPGVDFNDEKKTVTGELCVGLVIRSKAIWLCPNPEDTEKWKNEKYVDTFENGFGLQFPEGKDGKKSLVEWEPVDLYGRGALFYIDQEVDKRDLRSNDPERQNNPRKYAKIDHVQRWEDDQKYDIDLEEEDLVTDDVPF